MEGLNKRIAELNEAVSYENGRYVAASKESQGNIEKYALAERRIAEVLMLLKY